MTATPGFPADFPDNPDSFRRLGIYSHVARQISYDTFDELTSQRQAGQGGTNTLLRVFGNLVPNLGDSQDCFVFEIQNKISSNNVSSYPPSDPRYPGISPGACLADVARFHTNRMTLRLAGDCTIDLYAKVKKQSISVGYFKYIDLPIDTFVPPEVPQLADGEWHLVYTFTGSTGAADFREINFDVHQCELGFAVKAKSPVLATAYSVQLESRLDNDISVREFPSQSCGEI